jgi:hypothetical protein
MMFPTSAYLRKATSRAKSDVANKLVSMFLHGLSRKIAASIGLSVTDAIYTNAVEAQFGSNCCYCFRSLEIDRAAVEHLDGMNRFRLGLHIPGNVVISCKRCNGEKRRDDQLHHLTLAETGWQSFLAHDFTRCESNCKTCSYWAGVWPAGDERAGKMALARQELATFRAGYPESVAWAEKTKLHLKPVVDTLYRDCQEFATARIDKEVSNAFSKLTIQEVKVACATGQTD